MTNIAIFASGSGSNAENIIQYFAGIGNVSINTIVSNKPDAYVHQRAKKYGIESVTFNKIDFVEGKKIIDYLKSRNTDFIVLAGFLLKIPSILIEAYPHSIINIHPALLPKYGGKGMYGDRVHKAVVESGEKESGITIHYVNENYDEGDIIFQAKCEVLPSDNYEQVAHKVHELEYQYFPKIINEILINF